ncbi:MAG: NAD(P)/FAD-dependent oxidoreductase [Betaproteobacteria bacterium]|nr:NAD(P)/FAD-dependent oxidoreductase [Betaproteobacteria bacterium]
MPIARYDLVVIGSGPAGYKIALGAARHGAKVAVIERDLPGGTCLNEGCIPSRALHYPAGLIEDIIVALAHRGLVGQVSGDFRAAALRKDETVAALRGGVPAALQRLGIDLLPGSARFTAPGRIAIGGGIGAARTIETDRAMIATGSHPRGLAPCPVDGRVVIGSREFFGSLERLPRRVLCVGGGAIGVEAAYIARQFGAEVTVVERAARLLPHARVPEHVADLLQTRLERLGVTVRTATAPRACRVDGDLARVDLGEVRDEEFDLVLVAVGRLPNSAGLGLDAIGARVDESGAVRVDEYLETEARGVYAIGDARGGLMTAAAAMYDAKIAVRNVFGGERVRANYFKVPYAVSSAIELATVGLTEQQAEAAGFTPRSARTSFGASGKARARHDYDGFIEIVHDRETSQLLGGCIVGPEAGEQIQLLGAACQSQRGLWLLKDVNYSHPSWGEELETAIDPHVAARGESVENLFRPGIHAED